MKTSMSMNKHRIAIALALGMTLSASAHATLFDRGNGMVYDDVLDVTWLADANYAATQFAESGGTLGDADGLMVWGVASAWAYNLEYAGFTDWRLPTATVGCPLRGCTDSEMAHLFYVDLGGTADQSILTSTDPDMALFTNLQSYGYWTGTIFSPITSNAYDFIFDNGWQYFAPRSQPFYAWALTDGDVAAIPEPETYALLLAGLGLVGWAARRRHVANT
jgi:hypothetical protein